MATARSPARRLARASVAFVAIGLVLWSLLFATAERLLYEHGHANAFYKIATAPAAHTDWLILGASHAMPLDFDGFNDLMQRETGLKILNLASPGTGPLYERFVLERFLRGHRTTQVLYVADAFAFYSPVWNEERFTDAKLQARTPLDPAVASALWRFVRDDHVSWRAGLDYFTGFSKVNNRDRFETDAWEGEAQFERRWRPSSSAVKKRMDYLYPAGTPAAARERYLAELRKIVALARESGARVVVAKMPLPANYRAALPDEAAFDAALAQLAQRDRFALVDFTEAMPEPRHYFDSDHLNRSGAELLFRQHLRKVLVSPAGGLLP